MSGVDWTASVFDGSLWTQLSARGAYVDVLEATRGVVLEPGQTLLVHRVGADLTGFVRVGKPKVRWDWLAFWLGFFATIVGFVVWSAL